MKKIIKDCVRFGLIGMCIGSFVFLLSITAYRQFVITRSEVLSNLLMSFLIGEISMIFRYSHRPYLVKLIIHYLGTSFLVIVTGLYNHWIDNWFSYFIMVTIIYAFIVIVQYKIYSRDASDINRLIQKRKQNHH
ncbi:DUF3021 domain-containing protein [Lactobacillus sp. Sy-1]|uniref:DUF3021 domain-containing protein n=1 Tax=Lactobacillus sp. Sy-1 TaxID=2109645 RepID=UPI001C598E47|nr:DUF3021 domain-containing protein [Lactobacillus sp. Sy-1]